MINAEGEYQASTRLAEAADVLARNPISLQLRFLQTLTEIATEKNSTVVLPVPIDLLRPFLRETFEAGGKIAVEEKEEEKTSA